MAFVIVPPPVPLNALATASNLQRCARCGVPLNKWESDFDLTEPMNTPPLSQTRDGFLLADAQFLQKYMTEGWVGLEFQGLSNGLDRVSVSRRVRLVLEDRFMSHHVPAFLFPQDTSEDEAFVLNHSGNCSGCGRFGAAEGSGACVIERGEIPLGASEFALGHFEHGSGDSRAPFLIVGEAIHLALRSPEMAGTSVMSEVTYQRWDYSTRQPTGTAQIIPFPRRALQEVQGRDPRPDRRPAPQT